MSKNILELRQRQRSRARRKRRVKRLFAGIGIIIMSMLLCGSMISKCSAFSVTYTEMSVPSVNTSFKSYMDYRCVTSTSSPQYKFIHKWGWSDENGLMRCNGERELGINDDYYLAALGSYYGTAIGTKYRVTTDKGNVFYIALADCKANRHTNSTNQYSTKNKDMIEFLVDTHNLNKNVKKMGSCNVLAGLNGSIAKIEKMNFNYE